MDNRKCWTQVWRLNVSNPYSDKVSCPGSLLLWEDFTQNPHLAHQSFQILFVYLPKSSTDQHFLYPNHGIKQLLSSFCIQFQRASSHLLLPSSWPQLYLSKVRWTEINKPSTWTKLTFIGKSQSFFHYNLFMKLARMSRSVLRPWQTAATGVTSCQSEF